MSDDAPRRPLSRDLIVEAAVTLIERDGARALTMRKVAAELGVGVMSLYNHVPDRDALVAGIARSVLAGLDAAATPGEGWREDARALVLAFRAAARRHPRSVHLVLTTRVDLEFGWHAAERALTLLADAGFDGETSVRTLRALMAYAIGSQMMENGALTLSPEPSPAAVRTVEADPGGFPHTIALADELLHPDPDADFACGLEILLDAVEARAPRR